MTYADPNMQKDQRYIEPSQESKDAMEKLRISRPTGPYDPNKPTPVSTGVPTGGTVPNDPTKSIPNSPNYFPSGEIKAEMPQTKAAPDYASLYKQSFGTDATKEQLDWFNTQDPDAMTAHITGMGTAQKAQPPGLEPAGQGGWVPEVQGGMQGYKNPATGQWVPGDHPAATSAGNPSVNPNGGAPSAAPAAGSTPGATSYTPPNSAPGTPGANPVDTQGQNAQTYSQTPGAAPGTSTTNQGTQDVWRNKLLQMATQSTDVDPNDPAIRQQSDSFRAQAVRAAREMQADQAVAAGPTGSQFAKGQQRATAAGASQAAAQMETQLMGRDLANKRDEIKSALASLGAGIENDQRRALEQKLADLNASIQKLGIETGANTAAAEIALKDKLGTGGLNVDLMRALLQNQQFGSELGFNIADKEAYYNNAALQALMK